MWSGTSMETQDFNKQISWLVSLWKVYSNPTYCSPVASAAFVSRSSLSDVGYHLCSALGGCDSGRRCFWAFPTCTVTLGAGVCCWPGTAHVFPGMEQGSRARCQAVQVAARGKDKDARLEATAFVCCAENLHVCGSTVSRRHSVMKFCV